MHYIDAADNLAGQFQGGNANIGLKGTVVDASWLNAVQDEICNVITKSGTELDKNSSTQLRTAVKNTLPKYKHLRTVGEINRTTEYYFNQQTKIFNLADIFPNETLSGKFVDIRVRFFIYHTNVVDDSYFAASLQINKSNGSYIHPAWYQTTAHYQHSIECRWCAKIPDGLAATDAVVLNIYSRALGTSENPYVGVFWNGCFSVDPNKFILV